MAKAGWRDLLEKLMALHAVKPGCTERFRQLACRTDVPDPIYLQAVEDLEADLKLDPLPSDAATRSLVHNECRDECRQVLELARQSHRLLDRLRASPSLGSTPRAMVATLFHLADLRPDPNDGLATSDAPFMRILRYLNNSGTVNTQALLRENLGHLIALVRQFPGVAEVLGRLATHATWTLEMQAVEAQLDRRGSAAAGDPPVVIGPDARELLQMVEASETPPAITPSPLRAMLLQHPRFSALTRDEVLGFERVRDRYEDLSRPLFTSSLGDLSDREQQLAAANDLMNRSDWAADLAAMKSGLDLRVEIARHFRVLREIAKLDALERNWPDIYHIVKIDLGRIIAVEERLTASDSAPLTSTEPEVDVDLWQRCLSDAALVRLLRFRPRLRDINPAEYAHYQELAAQVPTSPSTGGGGPATISVVPGVAASSVPPAYLPLELTVTPTMVSGQYNISLRAPDESTANASVSIDLGAVLSEAEGLGQLQRTMPVTRELVSSEPYLNLNEILRRIGDTLYKCFIQDDVRKKFEALLQVPQNYRVFLRLDDPKLANLPWEALFLPSLNTAVSLTRRTSLVRSYTGPAGTPSPPFAPALNLLVIIPRPRGVPPLNGQLEREVLEATLLPARDRGLVKLKFLEGEEANLDELRAALRRNEAQIVQFVGHGRYERNLQKGQLIFQKGADPWAVDADDLAVMLRDSRVSLVVLNGCDTGRSSSNDALSSVAAAVVGAGVPAAVATMREVYDEAALRFTREFYRAFVDGYTLETSLTEARKALYSENWNWSAYALFSSVKPSLDFLRLLVPPGRSLPPA
jgi:CHAT domain